MHVFDMSVLLHVGVSSLEWAVHRIVGKEEKERLVVVTIDEVDRLAGKSVGEILGLDHWLSTTNDGVVGIVVGLVAEKIVKMEFLVAVPIARFGRSVGKELASKQGCGAVPGRGNEIVTFVSETKELIKTVAERMIVGGASLVPLANQAGGVAAIVKRFGNGDFFGRHADSGFFVHGADGVELITETGWCASSEEAGP